MIAEGGEGLTGATVRCDVRRSSDGLVLDFGDNTFKAVGSVGTRYRTLSQVSATDWPGLYEGTALDLSAIVGGLPVGAVLTVTYYMTAPSAVTLDQDELRVVAASATAANVSDGTAAVLAGITSDHGAGSYATATGFATSGALAAAQSDITTILGYGAPPSAATVATQVWATAHGAPGANTFGWLMWRLAQWGTEIADKAIVGQSLVLRSPDLATTYATVTLRDKDGGLITPATGEPARFDP